MWRGDALVSTIQSIETIKSVLGEETAVEELGIRFVVGYDGFGPRFSSRENEKLASSRDDLESDIVVGVRDGFLSSLPSPP